MCLTSIVEEYDKPSPLIVDGWKCFGGTQSRPTFENMAYRGEYEVPLDQWIKAEGVKDIAATDGKKYKPGFHVFEDEQAAKKLASPVRRVYMRRVHAKGEQNRQTVLVAHEIYVPSDPEAWPPMSGDKGPEGKPGVMDRIKKIAGKGGNA